MTGYTTEPDDHDSASRRGDTEDGKGSPPIAHVHVGMRDTGIRGPSGPYTLGRIVDLSLLDNNKGITNQLFRVLMVSSSPTASGRVPAITVLLATLIVLTFMTSQRVTQYPPTASEPDRLENRDDRGIRGQIRNAPVETWFKILADTGTYTLCFSAFKVVQNLVSSRDEYNVCHCLCYLRNRCSPAGPLTTSWLPAASLPTTIPALSLVMAPLVVMTR